MRDSSIDELTDNLRLLGISRLTQQEEIYVQRRVQGINPSAAARAAGYGQPIKTVAELSQREEIQQAISYGRELIRQIAVRDGAIEFTKDDATELYLSAHARAEDANTEIRAVDSLVKLHGLAAPEKKEVEIKSASDMKGLSDAELMEMSGSDLRLSPEDYKDVTDEQ